MEDAPHGGVSQGDSNTLFTPGGAWRAPRAWPATLSE